MNARERIRRLENTRDVRAQPRVTASCRHVHLVREVRERGVPDGIAATPEGRHRAPRRPRPQAALAPLAPDEIEKARVGGEHERPLDDGERLRQADEPREAPLSWRLVVRDPAWTVFKKGPTPPRTGGRDGRVIMAEAELIHGHHHARLRGRRLDGERVPVECVENAASHIPRHEHVIAVPAQAEKLERPRHPDPHRRDAEALTAEHARRHVVDVLPRPASGAAEIRRRDPWLERKRARRNGHRVSARRPDAVSRPDAAR